MRPIATLRAKLVTICAALLVFHGSVIGGPVVAAFGVAIAAALTSAYIRFYTVATAVRRGAVELGWSLENSVSLTANQEFALSMSLQNSSSRNLFVRAVLPVCQTNLEIQKTEGLLLSPTSVTRARTLGIASRSGSIALHGATVWLGDTFGFFKQSAYFPAGRTLHFLPASYFSKTSRMPLPKVSSSVESGPSPKQLRGPGGDFRELRPYQPGDSFKNIAWKATAKRRRLISRDLEDNVIQSHFLAMDIGYEMREGVIPPPLESAIDFATAYSLSALGTGDRLGMVCYDTRVYSETPVKSGKTHGLHIVQALTQSYDVVDEDLTEITASDLVDTVARYLAHQRAIDIRITGTPSIDSVVWEHLQSGPRGQLFDLRAGARVLQTLISRSVDTGDNQNAAASENNVVLDRDSDPRLAVFRRFCQASGIPLPYREGSSSKLRTAGLTQAIEKAKQSKAKTVILLSSFANIDFSDAGLASLVNSLLRKGGRIVCLAPALSSDSDLSQTDPRLESRPRLFPPNADIEDTTVRLNQNENYQAARQFFLGVGASFAPIFVDLSADRNLARIQAVGRGRTATVGTARATLTA